MRGREDGWKMRHARADPALGASEDGIMAAPIHSAWRAIVVDNAVPVRRGIRGRLAAWISSVAWAYHSFCLNQSFTDDAAPKRPLSPERNAAREELAHDVRVYAVSPCTRRVAPRRHASGCKSLQRSG